MHGDAGLHDLEGGIIFLKRRHIFTTLFLKIKLAALPRNILRSNKRLQQLSEVVKNPNSRIIWLAKERVEDWVAS